MNDAIRTADMAGREFVRLGRRAKYVDDEHITMTDGWYDDLPFGEESEGMGLETSHVKGAFGDDEEFDGSIEDGTLVLRRGRNEYRLLLTDITAYPDPKVPDFKNETEFELDADELEKLLKAQKIPRRKKHGFNDDMPSVTLYAHNNGIVYALFYSGDENFIGGTRIGKWSAGTLSNDYRTRIPADKAKIVAGMGKGTRIQMSDDYPVVALRGHPDTEGIRYFVAPLVENSYDDKEWEVAKNRRERESRWVASHNRKSRRIIGIRRRK